MEEFRIIKPASLLAPFVKHYWLLKTAGDSDAVARTVPTGMMNLIFHRGERLLSVHDHVFHERSFLSGQEKTFADLAYTGQINMICVVFRPAGAKAFFNFPLDRIKDIRVTAGDLGDREFSALEKAITEMEDDRSCFVLIDQFLLKRLRYFPEYNLQRMQTAIRLINAGKVDVAGLAGAACLSRKQFTRVFSEHTGSNPKEFIRTIRFQKALHLLETSGDQPVSLTALAYECGYYDQSHLIKDFKDLSGYTPGEYLAICPPHSDYFD